MINRLLKALRLKTVVTVKNIKDSTVNVIVWFKRPNFKVDDNWFETILTTSYTDDIKSKFIPILHQHHEFERTQLLEVLKFKNWLDRGIKNINSTIETLDRFDQEYVQFYQILKAENISITNPDESIISYTTTLADSIPTLKKQLLALRRIFSMAGYESLSKKNDVKEVMNPLKDSLKRRRNNWNKVLSKPPTNDFLLMDFSSAYDEVYARLNSLNRWLVDFQSKTSHKIIAGKAGTGKTHTSAYLIQEIKKNNDLVIFFKANQFNGDNIVFDDCILRIMQVPHGYRLVEVLKSLDEFARKKKKRLFLIFDALNETTTSTLGFSDIWKLNLPSLIKLAERHPNIYIISTLRTSYIESIWEERPKSIVELRGFDVTKDIESACEKYFDYYKIKVNNPDADLSYFSVPLLLDLFCKFVNESRISEVRISLDINSYISIFEGYINRLVKEVQEKRKLAITKPITDGLSLCADRFIENNEAILSLDDFGTAFDDPNSRIENSIARPILEGYLIFIKEKISQSKEIIKHTQQEIGGYLLAIRLLEKYPTNTDLLTSQEFIEKLIGTDENLHHQLRLDIIKFLIAARPEIITTIGDKDSLILAWWFLYNGYDGTNPAVPDYLLAHNGSIRILEDVLLTSQKEWFKTKSHFNFIFISELLAKMSTWQLDMSWTFYIYNNADIIFNFLQERIDIILGPAVDDEKEFIIARFAAFVTSTNIRELRDLATSYLIQYGQKFPLELVELAEYSVILNDSYIYERIVSSIYGVALIRQHDDQFVTDILPKLAERMFNLQFSQQAIFPVYNYIVIDSIKHLLDLAIYKGVWKILQKDATNISNYHSPQLPDWNSPSEEQSLLIDESDERNMPEPIKMDFAIYTIPRLVDHKDYELRTTAIANVYKRIFELGYLTYEASGISDQRFKDFYYGTSIYEIKGKVDRLGKKYGWKGFFDYAGVLLQQGGLNSFVIEGDPTSGYNRLSDVDIDISIPNHNHTISERIYPGNLMDRRSENPEWPSENKIDTIYPYLLYQFDEIQYVMLHGIVEQRINADYNVRSFLLPETFFIKKNDDYDRLKNEVCGSDFNWDRDIHVSPITTTRTYFGEFYWADNQIEADLEHFFIKTGKTISIKYKLEYADLLQHDDYTMEDIGNEIVEEVEEGLRFEGEHTLIDYLWESDSDTIKGFSVYIPTVKMGKKLGLKADPSSGRILDNIFKECFKTIEFEEEYFKNEFSYIRADLLKDYMLANNLALVYQVKQHSYELDGAHNRSMKYFVIDEESLSST